MPFKPYAERRLMNAEFDRVQWAIAARNARELPPFLFRYRNSDTPYFLDEMAELVKDNKMFFPGQPFLNDPADCMPVIESGISFAEYRAKRFPIVKNLMVFSFKSILERGEIGDEDCRKLLREAKRITHTGIRHSYETLLSTVLEEDLKKVGVLSLASSAENPVLWATYAKNSRGVCIRLENIATGNPNSTAKAVQYVEQRSKFDYYGFIALHALMVPSFTSGFTVAQNKIIARGIDQLQFLYEKSRHWSYEEEYRLIYFRGGGHYIDISPMRIGVLYIGAEVDSGKIETIKSYLSKSRNPPKLFCAAASKRRYGMDFECIPPL